MKTSIFLYIVIKHNNDGMGIYCVAKKETHFRTSFLCNFGSQSKNDSVKVLTRGMQLSLL